MHRQNLLIEAAAGAHERIVVDVSTVPCRRLYVFRREQGLPAGPSWSGIVPRLTPIAAACLAMVVLFATAIHIKRREFGTAAGTFTLTVLCLFVAWGRLSGP